MRMTGNKRISSVEQSNPFLPTTNIHHIIDGLLGT